MLKQKVYDIAGTNIENLGSELETKIKEESARHEHAWDRVGNEPGLLIWRIVNFHVQVWPKEHYGSFYSGDSYIVLHSYVEEETTELHFDLHFWLGQTTSQDEAGTAAYKTVELDTFLGDRPVQHREVEGYESPLFLSYFPDGVFVLEGGAESGFFHVIPENYPPRLLRVKGSFKHVHVHQVPLSRDSLNDGDVFILDTGKTVYQFIGQNSKGFEKHKASQIVQHIKDKRHINPPVQIIYIDQDSPTDDDETFWGVLGGKGPITPEAPGSDDLEKKLTDIRLFQLGDRTGNLTFIFVEEGHRKITPEHFHSNEVYLLDKGFIVYVWIGREAPQEEKKCAMRYAQQFVTENHGSLPIPISVVQETTNPRHLRKLIKEGI